MREGKVFLTRLLILLNAEGNLVTEFFINGHFHPDKVYTLENVGMAAIDS